MTQDVDLFGRPVEQPPTAPPRRKRVVHNDMDLIERVLHVAQNDGYAVIGMQERIYRVTGSHYGVLEIEAVPVAESEAVHQLLDNGMLTVGGGHQYRYRNNREGPGNSVLVPHATRQKARRWRALTRPSTWQPSKQTG
jgi:hypothetical protein